MTKAELLAWSRLYLKDTATPYLWSDAELTGYLQEAEKEATERADLLETEGEATYSTISIVSGTAVYALNPLVYEVNRARVSGEQDYLRRTSRGQLDNLIPLWEDETGTPTHYYVTPNNSIRLYPKPTATGTLNLVVQRLPLATMGTSPEINVRYHVSMLDWVYRLAYSKHDADTLDKEKALQYEQLFENNFGPKKSYKLHARQLKHSPFEVKDTYEEGY